MTETNDSTGDGPPIEEDARLHEATRLGDEEQWQEAFEILLELEEDYPENALLLAMMGSVASEMEARGQAYDYFRRSLAAQPTDPEVLVLLGTGLSRYDDPDAEGILRLAAITAPDVAIARFQYGSYLAREGHHELALAELAAARELEPGEPSIVRELAVSHWLSGARERAVEVFEEAAGLDPEDMEVRVLAAMALLLQRADADGALELVTASAELPDDGELQIAASLAAAIEEWDDEAWNALARAEGAMVPADPELIREAEEAIEAGPEASRTLLMDEVLPRLLHDRIEHRA